MPYFQHPMALVETPHVGDGTRVWAFAHILPGAVIGGDCNICDHTFIENDVRVGNRVTIKSGVQLWNGVVVEDDVFIGPNATFTNDRFPRSRYYEKPLSSTLVRQGASIGANSTILPGIIIGQRALVGAGSVITRDVPAFTIVAGNPARIMGYVDSNPYHPVQAGALPDNVGPHPSSVSGVTIYRLPVFSDLRGLLSVGEIGSFVPFEVKRFFLVYQVPSREVRGEHAHHDQHQFLVCVHGECRLIVDDGTVREEVHLNSPSIGVHIAPMVWAVQYRYSADAVLMALSSGEYRPEDYIRDYDEFQKLRIAAGEAK
jgi:acetyltransferase-like isoleucine patch superfamily enzyme/dTDP-4-dehydrorhamnose 3,5-epimerase-like enzyme